MDELESVSVKLGKTLPPNATTQKYLELRG